MNAEQTPAYCPCYNFKRNQARRSWVCCDIMAMAPYGGHQQVYEPQYHPGDVPPPDVRDANAEARAARIHGQVTCSSCGIHAMMWTCEKGCCPRHLAEYEGWSIGRKAKNGIRKTLDCEFDAYMGGLGGSEKRKHGLYARQTKKRVIGFQTQKEQTCFMAERINGRSMDLGGPALGCPHRKMWQSPTYSTRLHT